MKIPLVVIECCLCTSSLYDLYDDDDELVFFYRTEMTIVLSVIIISGLQPHILLFELSGELWIPCIYGFIEKASWWSDYNGILGCPYLPADRKLLAQQVSFVAIFYSLLKWQVKIVNLLSQQSMVI